MGIVLALILYVAAFLLIRLSVFIIAENQRGAIIRLGRFERVHRPGLLIVIPFIDRVCKVDLPVQIPEWQKLSDEQLETKIREIALGSLK